MKEDSLAILGGGSSGAMSKESVFTTKEENNNGSAINWEEHKINDAVYAKNKSSLGSGAIKNIV